MKKRNAPVVLVTLLLLLVGGVVVMGLRDADQKPGDVQQQPQQPPSGVLTGPKAAPSPEEIRGKVEKATGGRNPDSPVTAAPGDDGPSIALPSISRPERPKPNPNSVSPQWYVK